MGLEMQLGLRRAGSSRDETVMTWQKYGQIYGWFEKHVCGGKVETAKRYEVSVDALEELIRSSETVLEDPALAKTLLPCVDDTHPFPTRYDELYFFQLARVIGEIGRILADARDGDTFSYRVSCW